MGKDYPLGKFFKLYKGNKALKPVPLSVCGEFHFVDIDTVLFIAGKNAPKGKNMGHAGAIVSADGTGSAESKEAALADAGVYLAESTIDIVNKLRQVEKDLGIKLTQE